MARLGAVAICLSLTTLRSPAAYRTLEKSTREAFASRTVDDGPSFVNSGDNNGKEDAAQDNAQVKNVAVNQLAAAKAKALDKLAAAKANVAEARAQAMDKAEAKHDAAQAKLAKSELAMGTAKAELAVAKFAMAKAEATSLLAAFHGAKVEGVDKDGNVLETDGDGDRFNQFAKKHKETADAQKHAVRELTHFTEKFIGADSPDQKTFVNASSELNEADQTIYKLNEQMQALDTWSADREVYADAVSELNETGQAVHSLNKLDLDLEGAVLAEAWAQGKAKIVEDEFDTAKADQVLAVAEFAAAKKVVERASAKNEADPVHDEAYDAWEHAKEVSASVLAKAKVKLAEAKEKAELAGDRAVGEVARNKAAARVDVETSAVADLAEKAFATASAMAYLALYEFAVVDAEAVLSLAEFNLIMGQKGGLDPKSVDAQVARYAKQRSTNLARVMGTFLDEEFLDFAEFAEQYEKGPEVVEDIKKEMIQLNHWWKHFDKEMNKLKKQEIKKVYL